MVEKIKFEWGNGANLPFQSRGGFGTAFTSCERVLQAAEPKFCIRAKRYSSRGCSLISNREKSTLKLKSSASHSGNTLFLIWI